MKHCTILLLICLLTNSFETISQNSEPPNLTSFSATVYDNTGVPLGNTPVILKFSFRQGSGTGPVIYCATHEDTTNSAGLVTLAFNRQMSSTSCNGALFSDFEEIPWNEMLLWLEVEYQTTSQSNFSSLGVLEISSSYYAMHAGIVDQVLSFPISAQNPSDGDILTYDSVANNWISGAAFPIFSGSYTDLLNAPQNISYFSDDLGFITDANDADSNPSNEFQTWNSLPGIPADFVDGNDDVDDDDNDPANELQSWNAFPLLGIPALPGIPSDFTDGVDHLNDADSYSTNELQRFSTSLIGDTLFFGRANWIIVPGVSSANREMASCGANNVHNVDLNYGKLRDQEGNVYKTIVIGTQQWMTENLKTSIYRNGETIENIEDLSQWESSLSGAWCYFENEEWNECPNGKLYNWYAVDDARELCPVGWHVPNNTEWDILLDYIADFPNAGTKLKSSSNNYWNDPGTNEYGFSGIKSGILTQGFFSASMGSWWSSSEGTGGGVTVRNLAEGINEVEGGYLYPPLKNHGRSVRCVNDTINGSISNLYCGAAVISGVLEEGIAATGVSSIIPYDGGNGSYHLGQVINSTGVIGLTATLLPDSFVNGGGTLEYEITGTPSSTGTAYFSINIGGESCTLEVNVSGIGIGQNYQGGIIAYILQPEDLGYDPNVAHGFIIAPADQGSFPWGCEGVLIGGTQQNIGFGASNTSLIVAGCSQPVIAARVCNDLILNGYDDWYLPSIGELEMIYQNLYQNGIGNLSTTYWSSNDGIEQNALLFDFNYGFFTAMNKSLSTSVRAIRSF